MSALDQAFVKAYEQPAVAAVSPTCESSAAIAAAVARTASPIVENDLAVNPGEPAATAAPAAVKSRPTRTKPSRERKGVKRRSARQAIGRSASPERAAAGSPRDKSAPTRVDRSPGDNEPKPGGGFRPLLEVDAFLWPRNVGKLAAPGQVAMEQLTKSLLKRVQRGQKAIGWQACRHGDGCSTLLLAAARRLAEQGLKVVVVDADFRHPALARRLGLTPNSGWEEVAAGRLTPEEIVVESLQDGVSLAPWCVPPGKGDAESANLSKEASAPASLFEMLRQNYDMVLVDLGHGDPDGRYDELLGVLQSRLDAVLVVHKADDVPQAELRQVCRTLSRAGKIKLAVVENFV